MFNHLTRASRTPQKGQHECSKYNIAATLTTVGSLFADLGGFDLRRMSG